MYGYHPDGKTARNAGTAHRGAAIKNGSRRTRNSRLLFLYVTIVIVFNFFFLSIKIKQPFSGTTDGVYYDI